MTEHERADAVFHSANNIVNAPHELLSTDVSKQTIGYSNKLIAQRIWRGKDYHLSGITEAPESERGESTRSTKENVKGDDDVIRP